MRGVVFQTEIIAFHRGSTVKVRALEVNPSIFGVTVKVLVGRRGRVVNFIAVDINTRVVVLRDEEHRYDDVGFGIVLRYQIRFLNTEQSAFNDFAVFVIRRIVFVTVNEVNPIALLNGEPTVSALFYFRRGVEAVKFRAFIVLFATTGERAEHHRTRKRYADKFFKFIPHRLGLLKNLLNRKTSVFSDYINAYSIITQFVD